MLFRFTPSIAILIVAVVSNVFVALSKHPKKSGGRDGDTFQFDKPTKAPDSRKPTMAPTESPKPLRNGVIDPSASDTYDLTVAFDPNSIYVNCVDQTFRCEYYWASETQNATYLKKTYSCIYFVCADMTVTLQVFPQTCSGNNRIGIMKHDEKDGLSNFGEYPCLDSGCGSCSKTQITVASGTPLAFLQGCDDELSCYGQIEVSIVPSSFVKDDQKPVKRDNRDETQLKMYEENSPSPKFRGSPANRGSSPYHSQGLESIAWRFMSSAGFKSSPVIDGEGNIYIGSEDHSVYSIESNGAKRWRFATKGKVVATPALSAKGTVYVGSEDGTFYSLSAEDGSLRWEFKTDVDIFSSPVIGYQGIIYFGSLDGHLYALRGPGNLLWSFSVATRSKTEPVYSTTKDRLYSIYSSPALSPLDGMIYFGCEDSHLYAVSPGGVLRWAFKAEKSIFSSPAVSADGKVIYFGSDDGYLYAVNSANGSLVFSYGTQGRLRSSPAIAADGTIVIGQDESIASRGMLLAVSPSGRLKWKYELSEGTQSSPTIAADGIVYIGSDDHCIYAISLHDGSLKGLFKTEGKISSSPAIGSNGVVYVGVWGSGMANVPCSLYAFGQKSADDVDSSTVDEKVAPSYAARKWWCTDIAGGDLDYRCGTGKSNSDLQCVPGLTSYIGKGVDVTYDKMDERFLRQRVYDFTNMDGSVELNGEFYQAPSADFLTVVPEVAVIDDSPTSAYFSDASEFLLAGEIELKLGKLHRQYPAGKIPNSATSTVMANATYVRSPMLKSVDRLAKQQKYAYTQSIGYSVASLRMTTTFSTRHSCEKSFHKRIQELPFYYDAKLYKNIVKDFGTHVIVGARLGGSVTSSTAVEACAAKADHPSPRDSFAAFRAATEYFTVNSSDASMKFLGSEITRESQWVCGGDSDAYKKGSDNPFAKWKDTLIKTEKSMCLVSVDLIPIWATIRPIDQVVQGHLAAAVLDYLRTTAQQSDVNVAAPAKVAACNVLPGLQG